MLNWNGLDGQREVTVLAKPASGLWTPVRSYLGAGSIVRIEASGTWQPLTKLTCGPDGMRHWVYARDRLLTKNAPFGALIAKIGGGTLYALEADVIPVGSLFVLKVEKEGPLYLTINDAPDGFDDNDGAITAVLS